MADSKQHGKLMDSRIILFGLQSCKVHWLFLPQHVCLPLTIVMEKIIQINGIAVYGHTLDHQTRCVHWHSALDVIAIKFKCCNKYYPCHACHEEHAGHPAITWPVGEWDTKAILCGVCGSELTIREYKTSGNTCPRCSAAFNPACIRHADLYFASEK